MTPFNTDTCLRHREGEGDLEEGGEERSRIMAKVAKVPGRRTVPDPELRCTDIRQSLAHIQGRQPMKWCAVQCQSPRIEKDDTER